MKDIEFNEKFPTLVALQQSVELLNKKKYDEAITILENGLKADFLLQNKITQEEYGEKKRQIQMFIKVTQRELKTINEAS